MLTMEQQQKWMGKKEEKSQTWTEYRQGNIKEGSQKFMGHYEPHFGHKYHQNHSLIQAVPYLANKAKFCNKCVKSHL